MMWFHWVMSIIIGLGVIGTIREPKTSKAIGSMLGIVFFQLVIYSGGFWEGVF